MKNNNKFRLKRTVTGVSFGLLLLCNTGFSQDQSSDNTFTLNLKNTDIHSLISTVSKQTGRNFVVDPRVKAKVTVISTDPVSADGLYEVFLSVLQVHGYSAVPAGDLIKIVPDVTAKQGPVPILGEDSDSSDQLVTQVVPVINVPAAQLVPILRPMVPQQGHLAAYAATNSLIITDRSSNIQRLMEIIRRIDKPDNEEIEVVRLKHAAASEIVRTLTSLQRNNLGGPQGPGATQLVADERTNSVLISGDRAVRLRMRGLIAHLDTPIQSGGNTRVVYLRFANAEDMVGILQGVSQGQARVGASAPTEGGATTTQATQQVQPQQNANAGATQAVQPQLPTQANNAVRARSAADSGESNVDIQADPNTNSLIITAPPDEMQNILAVIRQLDIRRAQVLVEAVIAEITEDNTREFGINFLLDGSDKNAPAGFSNLGDATSGALNIAGALRNEVPPTSLGNGVSLALGRFGGGEVDFGFLVRAIASDADNNILSTPSLMTLDNEEAEIVVGSNVPFVTGTQLSANNNNPFQTIERRDIGLTLKVKPQINDGNSIKMELEQEVSDVNTTALTGASDITTSVRSIKTTVLVEDGQTIVLGGLIDDQITDVEEKVPLLGDIPILGNLFRYRSTQKSKQNLMIFLHPVIMRDGETASQFSNSKYNFLRSEQTRNRQEKEGGSHGQDETLPELKLFFKGQPIDSPLTKFDTPTTSADKLATTEDIDSLAVIGATPVAALTAPSTAEPSAVVADAAGTLAAPGAIPATDATPVPTTEQTAETAESPEPENAAVVASADAAPATTVELADVAEASSSEDDEPVNTDASQVAGTTEPEPQVDSPNTAPLVGRVEKLALRTGNNTPVIMGTAAINDDDRSIAAIERDAEDDAVVADSAALPIVETLPLVAADTGNTVPAAVAVAVDTHDADLAEVELPVVAIDSVEREAIIAMANIWQLGVSNTLYPSEESLAPQPAQDKATDQEVGIVSIVVVDSGSSGDSAADLTGNLGAVQVGPPIVPVSGSLQAQGPLNPGS